MLIFSFVFFFPVHVCDRDNNGGCDQICIKMGDEAECSCKEGFVLSEDDVTCEKGKRDWVFWPCHAMPWSIYIYKKVRRIKGKKNKKILIMVRNNRNS